MKKQDKFEARAKRAMKARVRKARNEARYSADLAQMEVA